MVKMILSRDQLIELSEAQLTRDVLVPLFQAMKFKDVVITHGSSEQGKDIVMWRQDNLLVRESIAVVVKAVRVSTGSKAYHDVVRQVKECFGIDTVNPVTLEKMKIDRVIVACSREVTKDAKVSFQGVFEFDKMANRVIVWDQDSLYEKVKEFFPNELVWSNLREVHRVLSDSGKEHGIQFSSAVGYDGRLSIGASPVESDETPEGPFLKGEMRFKFPESPLGKEKRKEWESFLDGGHAISFGKKNIEEFDISGALEGLGLTGEVVEVNVGPIRMDEPKVLSLEMFKGEEIMSTFNTFIMSHKRSGRKESALMNYDQSTAIKLDIICDKESLLLGCRFGFRSEIASAYEWATWFTLRDGLEYADKIIFRDWRTGIQFAGSGRMNDIGEAPSLEVRQFISCLSEIQTKLGVELIPDLELVTRQEMADVVRFGYLLRNGYILQTEGRVDITVDEETEERLQSSVGELVAMTDLPLQPCKATILGKEIDLGDLRIVARGKLEVSNPDSTEAGRKFFIKASAEVPFVHRLLKWKLEDGLYPGVIREDTDELQSSKK